MSVLSCAGELRCWGSGSSGQLGYGNGLSIGDDEAPAAAGDVPVGGAVSQVSAGNIHTCAVLVAGGIRCWGYGFSGQLGYGNMNYVGLTNTPASAGDVPVF